MRNFRVENIKKKKKTHFLLYAFSCLNFKDTKKYP